MIFLSLGIRFAGAYAVLSHEETVDLAWDRHMVPLLLQRYPGATPQELRVAHSYAYGGCIIQDLGYYPFGSHQFSDLLHYVRTGDFVDNLLKDSTTLNEYAFALGALAHYRGDTTGHPAIGIATAREYPKLRNRFGPFVSYYDSPKAHIRTEFGFDVVQVAQGHYVKDNYDSFVGFNVAMPLLKRAFKDTYGIDLDTVLKHEDLAVNSYRYSVSSAIPEMTRVAVLHYGKQIQQEVPSFDRRKFVYTVKRVDYEHEWGKQYHRPGVGAYMIEFLIKIMPKVGPLSVFRLKLPNADDQKTYLNSMQTTLHRFDGDLEQLQLQSGSGASLKLANLDYDTGKETRLGEYPLADRSYATLLNTVVRKSQGDISPDLRTSLLDYYAAMNHPHRRRAYYLVHLRAARDQHRLQANLRLLRDESPANSLPTAAKSTLTSSISPVSTPSAAVVATPPAMVRCPCGKL